MNRLTLLGSFTLVCAAALAVDAQTPAGRVGRGSLAGREAATRLEQPAGSQAKVRVDVSRVRAASIEVQQPEGASRAIDAAASQVLVNPWQYVAVRTGTEVAAIEPPGGSGQAWALPVIITTANAAGTQFDLEIVVAVDNGLMLRGNDGVYTGDVFVGVMNRQNRAATDQLGAPVHVLMAGQVDAIDPAAGVEITHTNQPFQRVALRARPTGDQVLVTARASFSSDNTEVPIRVVRPHLLLTVTPPSIEGFGLETADVVVQAEGHPNPGGLAVAIIPTAGRMEPDTVVTLNEGGVATARVRANGLGRASVTATGAGFADSDPRPIEYGIPWLFGGGVLLGGAVGGLLRYRKRRGSSATLPRVLGTSVLRGLAVAALYVAGINVFTWTLTARTGAVVVFICALFGVWVDPRALAKRSGRP